MLAALADVALGRNIGLLTDPTISLVTTNLSIDYIGSVGDWLETELSFHKAGSRVAFSNGYLRVGDKRVGRVSAVFTVVGRRNE